MMTDIVGIAIFAKAPIAGFAKTRLIPTLGPERASQLQRQLIERTVETALASKVGPVSVWYTPDRGHDVFTSLAAVHSIEFHRQSGADLGARMLSAFEVLIPRHPLLVIGTDCPMLQPSHLIDCATSLRRGADAVFLPTEDGGYALVGLTKPVPLLFHNMPWSTEQVMSETRLRAHHARLGISEPALVWDVDTKADYDRAVASGLFDRQ